MTKDKSTCRNEPDGWDAQAIKDEPRVEEIRIHTSGKKKETACLSTECEEQPRKAISPKSRDSEWFKGTDDIKYKIDKITGEIDENGADKWFEGVDNIKSKIDEKVSKKIKKKNRQIN